METTHEVMYFETRKDAEELLVAIRVPDTVSDDGLYRFKFAFREVKIFGELVVTFVGEDEEPQTIIYEEAKDYNNGFAVEKDNFHARILISSGEDTIAGSIEYWF